ncbi:MAG TPA: CHASE2 domain-containing protein, partial [Chromatiales bacterium]|nr:CHASE2 domain-containing protein [Chromatiales bacterium]
MHSNELMNRRKPGLAGPLALLLILLALVWAAGARMMRLEYSFYDLFQQQQTSTASDRILVVDASTPDAGRSLWDDPRLPGLIKQLDAAGAIIVPTEPPPASTPMPDLRQLTKLLELEQQRARRNNKDVTALSSQLAEFRKQFENRANSEAAVAKARNVVLALAPMNHTTAEFMLECENLAATGPAGTLDTTPPAREYLGLPATLCGKTGHAGYSSFRPDPDGIVRESSLLVRSKDRAVPTLALAALAASLGDAPVSTKGQKLMIGERSLSTGPGFGILHRYYHQAGPATFETRDLDALLTDKVTPDAFDGKIVLIGRLAHETTYRTPVDSAMPGTLLVATSLSNLLQGDYLLRPGWLPWAELALLIALSVLLLLLTPELSLNAA